MKNILIKLIVILTLYSHLSACSNKENTLYINDVYYNFLQASMVGVKEDNPLYKLSASYFAHNKRFDYFRKRKKEENIKAWQRYFQHKLSSKEIENIFYLPNSIKNTYLKYKNHKKELSFVQYLSFLLEQNQQQSNKNYKKVLKRGLTYIKKESDSFLKERYLYLVMRLYHHHSEYQKTLDIYQKYQHIIVKDSIVKEWIDALRAGAYQHLKQFIKSNQLYAKIFKNNQTNAHYGYYDFKIDSDNTWNKLLLESKDKNETALYFFLRAMNWKNEPLLEFETISKIAPQSIWFKRLNYMLMQDFQKKRYELIANNHKKNKSFQKASKSYNLQKKRFFKILNRIKKPTFFTLYSRLYLQTLEYVPLRQQDKKQLLSLASEQEKSFVKLLSYLNTLHQLENLSDGAQKILFKQLKPLVKQLPQQRISLLRYTALQLATLYPEKGVEKVFNELYAKNKKLSRCKILKQLNYKDPKDFKNYIEKNDRRFLDRQIFKSQMSALEQDDVAKILATLYFQNNNFEKAQFYLRHAPLKNVYSPYNPFNAMLSGNNRIQSKKSYSQREFAHTMFRIQKSLEKNPHSSRDHFLYANGLFNKSWFGNFPNSAILLPSNSLIRGQVLPQTIDLTQAQTHYHKALKYAKMKDFEIKRKKKKLKIKHQNFKAQISYQLLKIEFHKALSNTYRYDRDMSRMPVIGASKNGTKKVMKVLRQSPIFIQTLEEFKIEYEDTEYGKEAIENCITFQYF